MELLELMAKRRSIRKYTEEEIPEEKLNKILQAALLAPTSRNRRPWEFFVVKDPEVLKKLSKAKAHGANPLAECNTAIAVFTDSELTDTWIEDASIVLAYMDLMAANQGEGYESGCVDFVTEAIRTYVSWAGKLGEGIQLSVETKAHLDAPIEFEHLANRGMDTPDNRLYALSHAMFAAEEALLEKARNLVHPRSDLRLGCNFTRFTSPTARYAHDPYNQPIYILSQQTADFNSPSTFTGVFSGITQF